MLNYYYSQFYYWFYYLNTNHDDRYNCKDNDDDDNGNGSNIMTLQNYDNGNLVTMMLQIIKYIDNSNNKVY